MQMNRCKNHCVFVLNLFNSSQHDKILDQTKLKALADDKLNVTKMIISVFNKVENIVGKMAWTSNFSFSQNVFKWLLSQTHQKVPFCGNGLTPKRSKFKHIQTQNTCTLMFECV